MTDHEEDQDNQNKGDGSSEEQNPRKNPMEWGAVIAGALLLVGLSGYLIFRTITENETKPSMTVWVEEGRREGDLVEYIIKIRNDGLSAQQVQVEVCDRVQKCRDYEFAYVPTGGSRDATVVLDSPAGEVEATIVAFSGT